MKKLAPFAAALLFAFLPLLLKEAALPTLVLFFAVIPGYCLLRLLKAEMETLPFAVSCAILSYLIATYAVYLVSLAIGYSKLSIALAFAITALPLLFLNSKFKFDVRKLRQETPVIAASIAVFAVILVLASFSIWRETEAGIINGGWNWSDFGVHLSIIQSLNSGNFPPQAPFFSGAPLNYHWFADLRTAIASNLSGIFSAYLARYETAAYAMLAFAACYIFAERLTRRRDAALICAALLLFGGGLGWLKLVAAQQHASASGAHSRALIRQQLGGRLGAIPHSISPRNNDYDMEGERSSLPRIPSCALFPSPRVRGEENFKGKRCARRNSVSPCRAIQLLHAYRLPGFVCNIPAARLRS